MDQHFLHDDWRRIFLSAAILGVLLLLAYSPTLGQQPVMISTPAGAQPVSPDQAKAMMEAGKAGAPQPGAPPATPPGQEPKKEGEEKKEGEGEKKEGASETVKRPEKPPRVPDPREFDVKLDEHGRVPPFNFIGQPWPDVLQWLANISKSSLNWQELPNDYLNLTTQRSYTVEEVRDLINRHLSARGYTTVQAGQDLSVFKIEKLDPSLVRRVEEEELYDLKPYDFAKISFQLPTTMEVDKAKEDVKQVLSPHAKVFPLVTTKRLLVMDSVANLRMVSALLNEERGVQDGRLVPEEFPLKYARPEKVIDILYVVLGLDPQSRPTQMELQLQQQKLQLMTQMQQQGKDVASMLKKDGPPVYLAYNKQRNSIIANAPPEQMKIIKQTIAYLDVPFGDPGTPEAGPTVTGQRRMEKYPLTTLDPETFIMTLEEIGGLNPNAEFKVDKKSKTLFALANDEDHEKIKSLIEDFDGSGREFEVIWLRRLPADAVAATIYNLMAGQEEKDESRNRRPYWYYSWDEQEEEDKPVQGFGVDADIENNRLLLWANEAEMERVRGLLVKLGEIPEGQQDLRRVRFVQPSGTVPTAQLLDQIREAWSASGNNELIIKLPTKPETQATEPAGGEPEKKPEEKTPEPDKVTDRSAESRASGKTRAQFVQLGGSQVSPTNAVQPAVEAEAPANEQAAENSDDNVAATLAKPAPVTISIAEDGRLMISSSDPVALDRMEELIEQLTPPDKRYKVFSLEHITALNMYWNLTDFFKEELEGEDSGNDDFMDWYFGFRSGGNQKEGPSGLSKRRKLMITYDTASNTILVANASPSQLREVEDLITEYDKPAPADSVRTRRTVLLKIKYSKAEAIAEALKEVYRDLLSSKDKEFQQADGNGRQRGSTTERMTVIRYGSGGGSEGSRRPTPMKVGFEGALSIGVDEISNTLLISVQEELYDSVVAMVDKLDQQAAPNTVVRVHRVNGNVSAAALRETIDDALSRPWVGGKPDPSAARGGGDRGGQRGDGERRGGDRRRGDRRRDRDRDRDNDNDRNRDNDNDNDGGNDDNDNDND